MKSKSNTLKTTLSFMLLKSYLMISKMRSTGSMRKNTKEETQDLPDLSFLKLSGT